MEKKSILKEKPIKPPVARMINNNIMMNESELDIYSFQKGRKAVVDEINKLKEEGHTFEEIFKIINSLYKD